MTEERAIAVALAQSRVASWLERYPPDPTTSATFRDETRTWLVKVWSGEAGQIAQAVVHDTTETASEVRTGPQVAWGMARGGEGSFGGKTLLKPYVWLAFCLVFFVGLADLRRPFSLRNVDLLVLLSFSVSLAFFGRGDIFTSVPLVYPVLGYLLARSAWVGIRKRQGELRPVWPTWVFAAAAIFLLGFRVGLNVEAPRGVIDVGLAGVVGASRILDGEAPYGNMPQRGDLEECGPEGRGRRRPRADPDERALRGRDRAWRHVRAGRVRRLRSGHARLRVERKVGFAPGRARDVDPVRPADHPRARARRAPLRGRAARSHAGLRLVRLPVHGVHPEREHERHDHARVPRLRLLARLVDVGARHGGRAGRVDEVRWTAPRAALGQLPDARAASPRALRPRVRAGDPRLVRRSCCSSPIFGRRFARSGAAPSASRPDATPRSRSGAGASTTRRESRTSGSCSRSSPCLAVALAVVARVRAAGEGPDRARRADGRRSSSRSSSR